MGDALGLSLDEAYSLKRLYFSRLPRVGTFITRVVDTAKIRGNIFNWLGRRYTFPDPAWAYKAPNYLIQGSCADVMKTAMVNVAAYLRDNNLKSRVILSIHDELICEIDLTEVQTVPRVVVEIMESAYPGRNIRLKVDPEWSAVSMADKQKGYPV